MPNLTLIKFMHNTKLHKVYFCQDARFHLQILPVSRFIEYYWIINSGTSTWIERTPAKVQGKPERGLRALRRAVI